MMARRMDQYGGESGQSTLFRRRCRRSLPVLMLASAWLAGVALPSSAAEPPKAAPAPATIEDLGWLTGSWSGESNGMRMEEHWTDAGGGGLVGMHKDVKAGKMVSFEFFRIGPDKGGKVTYFTQPGGVPAIPFVAIEMSSSRVVFENAAHDFPQRILYWAGDDGRLHARIEGMMNGKTASEEWSWARMTAAR
ncbi:MAG TPA: DUF6265 family protein [Candidatus Eisenbacteria bacterium]